MKDTAENENRKRQIERKKEREIDRNREKNSQKQYQISTTASRPHITQAEERIPHKEQKQQEKDNNFWDCM